MQIKDLNTEQILQLRKEIVLNSIFTNDYENSFDIPPQQVQDFFDCYIEYCEDCFIDENFEMENNDYFNLVLDFANDDINLIEYFNTIEWGN